MNKDELYKYQDLKYRQFHSKLVPNIPIDSIIGIRVPILRKLAKSLNYDDLKFGMYEENMLKSLTISNNKDINVVIKYLEEFVPHIDNWAICDTLSSSLKITKKYKNEMFNFIIKYIDGSEFERRFLISMLLDYYVDDEYLDRIINIIKKVNIEEYYVIMAVAWLLSVVAINYDVVVLNLLKEINNTKLNKLTISKMRDSYRIDKSKIDKFKKGLDM